MDLEENQHSQFQVPVQVQVPVPVQVPVSPQLEVESQMELESQSIIDIGPKNGQGQSSVGIRSKDAMNEKEKEHSKNEDKDEDKDKDKDKENHVKKLLALPHMKNKFKCFDLSQLPTGMFVCLYVCMHVCM